MQVSHQTRGRGKMAPFPEAEKLERAMVAGLMLEVILEAPGWPDDPQNRRRLLKSRLTDALVVHLAGHITLDHFRTLVYRLEQWFPFYYPLMPLPPPEEPRAGPEEGGGPSAGAGSAPSLVRCDLLKEWLETTGSAILPRRPQRKLHPDRLEEFLQRTQGRWFQAKVFAQDFDIDRKTAWEYLQKLQDGGLLVHNGGRSAAARYRLADRFLKVQVAALRRQVVQALTALSGPLAEPVTEWLAATAGEPFWDDRWPNRLAAGRGAEILAALESAAVLEVVCQVAGKRMLRLPRRWLHSRED